MPNKPVEQSERPQEPIEEAIEEAMVNMPSPSPSPSPSRTLDEPLPLKQSAQDVVKLFFDDEAAESDNEEMMEFDEQPVTIAADQSAEIQNVMPVSDSNFDPLKAANAVQETELAGQELAGPSEAVLADLKPVRLIEVRRAVEVPPLLSTDNSQLREPADQALAVLRRRKPLIFFPIYREPWLAHRDSYSFHHNPLWFEDPNLERCGRGWGHSTTMISAVRFAANIPILPYRATAERSHSCVRTLPDCTVCERFGHDAYLPPWSWSAAAVQAAATVGFIYAIP